MKKVISIFLVAMMLFSVMTVLASAATYSESESNDSYSTADTLKLNSSINAIMNNSNDVDIFKVTTSSNGKISFSFNHTHTDESNVIWWIYVYNYVDGKYNQLSRIQVNGYSDEKVDFPAIGAVSSGVYYIKVNTAYNNTTKYSYSISCSFSSTNYYEKEMNDSYATATEISTNKEYKGYMNNSDDVDIYKITTSKSGKITLTFNHTHTDESNVIWWIYVYQYENGKYNQLSRNQVNGYSDEKVELPSIGTVPSGIYYIKVNTAYNNTTNHEYSITAKAPSEPTGDVDTGETDGGNNNNSAGSGFSFMDILNAILDFFKWIFSAVISLFA